MVLELVAIVVLGGGAKVRDVEVEVASQDEPGLLEVLGSDGGVRWSEYLPVVQPDFSLRSEDRYTVRLVRDAGTLVTPVPGASAVFRMRVETSHSYVEVETFERLKDVTLEISRKPDVAPFYVLKNSGARSWDVFSSLRRNHGKDWSSCWVSGGDLGAKSSLSLGWVDEVCVLESEPRGNVTVELREAGFNDRLLRQRTFVVERDITASRNRWIPDDGGGPDCVCIGTEVGPERERLINSDLNGQLYRRRDGGLREESHLHQGQGGDIAPYVLPPGAADDPDFSEWQ